MFYELTASTTTFTDMAALDWRERPFGAGLKVIVPSTVSAVTYTVYYTQDDLQKQTIPTSITRSTTTATVVLTNHTLNVGDYIRVTNGGAPFDGFYKVASVTDKNTFTYTVANSGLSTAKSVVTLTPIRRTALSAFSSNTASADGDILYPVTGVNLDVTAYTGAGNVTLQVRQGPSSA